MEQNKTPLKLSLFLSYSSRERLGDFVPKEPKLFDRHVIEAWFQAFTVPCMRQMNFKLMVVHRGTFDLVNFQCRNHLSEMERYGT